MRKVRERVTENRCKAWAKRRGWWVRKFKSPGRRSAPDDIFAFAGRVVFWEFKASGEVPTELQLQEHEEMRAAGLTVRWTDNFEQFEREMLDLERRINSPWLE